MGRGVVDRKFDVATGRKGPTTYELQKMRSIHKRIVEDAVLGAKDVDIAEKRGVTPQMVAYTRKSKIVQEYYGILEGAVQANVLEVAKEIQELAPLALRTLEHLMLNPGTQDRLKADIAKDLLDRAGHGSVKKVAVADMTKLSGDDIDDIKRRAREARLVGRAKQEGGDGAAGG